MNTHLLVSSAKAWLMALALGLLTACGGGNATGEGEPAANAVAHSTPTESTPSFQPTSSSPPSEQTIALQKEGARLNSEELTQIAQTGVLPKAFEGKLLSGAEQKAATERTAVYRFYNTKTGAHFYTTSTAERDNVQATLPFMGYEGPAFYASAAAVPGLSPVHRFYNTQTGVHFYTISEAERASVVVNLPQFNYEGVAYYASTLPGTGYTPLYRFFYAAKGFHFYTNSQSERDTIIATLPQYSYEGVGYYVLGSDWQAPAIPHSGITSGQCYQAGSSALVSCASAGALALNPQQDGHRVAINAMSYGGVAGHKPLDSCVQDKVTGLIWEVKTASGVRNGANTYSNTGSGAATDSSGYVAAINAMQLCGFNDWRMPTVQELQGLVDHSVAGNGPMVNTAWFPHTQADGYWATDLVSYWSGAKWHVDFDPTDSQVVGPATHGFPIPVRLVRGVAWTGPRYVIDTRSYSEDGPNNVVIDRQTGLTWRRCEEGRKWDGDMCTGVANTYTHEAAMVHARGMPAGWRLPNFKELESLVDRSVSNPAIHAPSFPGATPNEIWSSSPLATNSSQVMTVSFEHGWSDYQSRGNLYGVRLVSTNP